MAKQKTRDHLFKPGQSGNPSGRPPVDPELKALRELTLEQFKEMANLVLMGKRQDAADLVNDQNAPLFKRWLAKLADQGFSRGEKDALEFFLNRLVGKVPDKIEAIGAIAHADVPVEELRTRLEALRKTSGNPDGTGKP